MAIEPVTREERFLAAAGGQSVTPPTPVTRKEQLLQGIIDAVKSGGATPDVIENAVNNYLNANPVQPGATTEQAAQIEQNKTDIADLQTEVDELKESGGNGSGQNVDLTGYAKESWVQEGFQPKGNYLTEVPEGYAKTEDIPTKPEDIGAQPKGNYALASAVPTKVSQLTNDAGYLTEHQDISSKLDADKLPEAVEDALAQAKASGKFDGKAGTSVTVSNVSESTASGGTNIVTFSDGQEVSIKNGTNGTNGKTPVRGEDYYTDADKAEMVAAVIAALPDTAGVSY